jgi:hypothetical protein
MIIWSGWGFLAAVIGFGCLLLTEYSVEAAMQDEQYYQNHGWPKFVGFVVAAVVVWPVGRALNRYQPGRELIDANTGERVVLPASGGGHTLFFVPMEYWAALFVVIGLVFLVIE